MTAEAPADTGGGRVRRRARRTPLAVLGIYLGLAAAAAIALLPFALSLMTAFARDPARRSPLAPPDPWPPDSFGAVLGDPADLAGAARTTLAAVVVVTCAQVASSVLAAYAFAQLRFPGREPLFRLFLVAMTIPTTALVVPLYPRSFMGVVGWGRWAWSSGFRVRLRGWGRRGGVVVRRAWWGAVVGVGVSRGQGASSGAGPLVRVRAGSGGVRSPGAGGGSRGGRPCSG